MYYGPPRGPRRPPADEYNHLALERVKSVKSCNESRLLDLPEDWALINTNLTINLNLHTCIQTWRT